MTLLRTVEPAAEPVTLTDAKAHLRLSGTSEDGLISGLIKAARQDVERATGMALIDQGWRLCLDDWPAEGCILLMRHPVRAIVSVKAYDTNGVATTVPGSAYVQDLASRPARLLVRSPPPTALRALNGVEIDFTAGFGEAGTDVPDLLRRAIVLLVAHWYEFRASFGADEQPVSYPPAYERMIAGYRLRRL